MIKSSLICATATATALVALTGSAYAGTVTVNTVSVPYYLGVTWDAFTLPNVTAIAPPTGAGIAGEILLTVGTTTYASWCVDLFHDVYVGGGQSLPYTTGPLTTDNSGASPLTSNTLSSSQQAEISWLAAKGTAALNASPLDASATSAAYQAAIWTVEYGLNQSSVAATSDESNFASDYSSIMTSLSGATLVSGAQLYGDSNIAGLYSTQNLYSSAPPAPEAATITMMLMGFAGLGLAGRRQLGKSRALVAA